MSSFPTPALYVFFWIASVQLNGNGLCLDVCPVHFPQFAFYSNATQQQVLWTGIPIIVSLMSFAVFTWLGNELTPDVTFTSISLFNLLGFPLAMLPTVINFLIEASVSADRLRKYLLLSEVNVCIAWIDCFWLVSIELTFINLFFVVQTLVLPSSSLAKSSSSSSSSASPAAPTVAETDSTISSLRLPSSVPLSALPVSASHSAVDYPAVMMSHANMYWDDECQEPAFIDLSLSVAHGELVAIAGQTGLHILCSRLDCIVWKCPLHGEQLFKSLKFLNVCNPNYTMHLREQAWERAQCWRLSLGRCRVERTTTSTHWIYLVSGLPIQCSKFLTL